MKKIILCVVMALVLVSLIAVPAFAAKGDNPANDNPNNLYLYEKDANWDIVWDGASGKMSWNQKGAVTFNGHKLESGVSYSLIVYTDPWPGDPITIIGTATANKGGNVNIKGSLDAGDYPQIWLVLADDVTESGMTGWNPSEYLFEHNAITIP